MAGSYGSASRPVVLDPFRRIVEVGWTDITHVAFAVSLLASTVRVATVEVCSPVVVDLDEAPLDTYTGVYLRDLEYWGLLTSAFAVRENDAWGSVPAIDVTGLPSLDAASFSYPAWTSHIVPNSLTIEETIDEGPPVIIAAEDNLSAVFRPDTGTDTEINVPGDSVFFQTGVTPAFAISVHEFVSADPVCTGFELGGSGFVSRQRNPTLVYFEPLNFPLDDIVAHYFGKTYRAVAARIIPGPFAGSEDEVARRAWILCEREVST